MTPEQENDLLQAVTRIDVNTAALVKQADDHEVRIRSLERYRWTAAGGVGLLSAIASYLGFQR